MARKISSLVFLCLFVAGAPGAQQPATEPAPATKVLTLTSSAFKTGEAIPKRYTADGMDVSPPLKWKNVPDGCKSLALIADDPDAPVG
ncbi:MAG TPA: YbhB/YbcL family Raf kinase inhibitor-like protein, partial [Firmicutes bacterium]|nr:YbhB/YbcL family Raf kinase inhibitor-like protein [Bacillota bacterium]